MAPLYLARIYDQHAAFVWRTVRLLGVPAAACDDAVQEVFLVVHRRLREFEGRASVRTWLYAIARGVALNLRRQSRRREQRETRAGDIEPPAAPGPHELVERAEAGRLLVELVATLDPDKRDVFVLVEVEQVPVPEVARLLDLPLNTAYSRLRAARLAFERALVARRPPHTGTGPGGDDSP